MRSLFILKPQSVTGHILFDKPCAMLEIVLTASASIGALIWIGVLISPWRAYSTKERVELSQKSIPSNDLSSLTVLIPARNEAEEIADTLRGIQEQGLGLRVILIDDHSSDNTADVARQVMPENLQILQGKELPRSWSGKLWALEQGRKLVETENILLLDADIQLKKGILPILLEKFQKENLDFLSVMAFLRMKNFWERLLIPAYIYFFKLLYPFALANNPKLKMFSSGAGGCILTKRDALEAIGGYGAIKDALIDDCELAKAFKTKGFRTWIGLSQAVTSHRGYEGLRPIWNLVARSAFTYLKYSWVLLFVCSILLVCAFWALPASLIFQEHSTEFKIFLGAGLASMFLAYAPMVFYYKLSPLYLLLKPIAGSLYMMMTWSSAIRYLKGTRSEWKGRVYDKDLQALKKAS